MNVCLIFTISQFNCTSNGRWKVIRGVWRVHDAGRAIQVDGQTEMSVWGGEKCNRITGTDGLLFAPLRAKHQPVSFFVKQLCAPLNLHYKRTGSFRGIDLHVFTNEFIDIQGNDTTCFCRELNRCPFKGTMDLMPCVQAPITLSLPHFLHADQSLITNIASGLYPNEKHHEFFMSLEMVNKRCVENESGFILSENTILFRSVA